jgi:O-antigen/teichoic acid export membrane protein
MTKNRSRYILFNTISSYGRDIVDTVAFLILIPFMIVKLGKENFGLWSLIWSFLSIFDLADLGFAASVIKYVADARGRNDMERLKRIICTLFWIYVFLGCIVMIGISSSLLVFNRIFEIPSDKADVANAVLIILGLRSAMYLPLGLFRGVLVGFQKMNAANVYKAISNLLYLVMAVIFLTLKPDLRVLAAVNLITSILPMFAMMLHCRMITSTFSINPRHFDRSLVKELSSFSIYFSLTQMAGMIATRADAMVIKLFLPLEMVGIYSVGMRLSEKATQFCSHLTRALTPVFAELHGANEQANIRAVHYRGTKLTVAFATPLLLGLAILAHPLILAWTGPDFLLAVPVCNWLVAASMVTIVHSPTVSLLSMSGYHKFVAIAIIGGQLTNLLLSFVLVQPLGIVGVSMATLIAAVPIYFGLIQGYVNRLNRKSYWDFYKATVLPSAIPAFLMAVVLMGVLRYRTPTNLVEVAILEALGMVVFGILYWIIGFRSSERDYFKEKLRRALLRQKASTSPTDPTV